MRAAKSPPTSISCRFELFVTSHGGHSSDQKEIQHGVTGEEEERWKIWRCWHQLQGELQEQLPYRRHFDASVPKGRRSTMKKYKFVQQRRADFIGEAVKSAHNSLCSGNFEESCFTRKPAVQLERMKLNRT